MSEQEDEPIIESFCPLCGSAGEEPGWKTWKCGNFLHRAPDKDRPPACIEIARLNERVRVLEEALREIAGQGQRVNPSYQLSIACQALKGGR